MVQFWRLNGPRGNTPAMTAPAIEAEGWDGQHFMDSQSLNGDPYALMGAWAMMTERLGLCTGVTNPLTRHPAVTASSIATIQAISGGRAALGIGRGDSALAYLGHAPAKLARFERALQDIQALLRGEEVVFEPFYGAEAAGSIDTLSLGGRPSCAGLKWLSPDVPKVPLDVAATGPKVIAMGARIAERVTFSVGATPTRVGWAIDLGRAAAGERHVSWGVEIIVMCHPDIEAVRDAATSAVAPLARFQVMLAEAAGPLDELDRRNLGAIRRGYDMNKHSSQDPHSKIIGAEIDFDFVRRFAIVGPPDHCIERLRALIALGIERFVVVGPGFHPEYQAGRSLFAEEVIPALRN
jgi:5,10-methylenetetrahydromethanopterin reductase